MLNLIIIMNTQKYKTACGKAKSLQQQQQRYVKYTYV